MQLLMMNLRMGIGQEMPELAVVVACLLRRAAYVGLLACAEKLECKPGGWTGQQIINHHQTLHETRVTSHESTSCSTTKLCVLRTIEQRAEVVRRFELPRQILKHAALHSKPPTIFQDPMG